MALNSAAITAGIAALSVSGVTFKDVGNIPATVTTRDVPLVIPQFDQFSTGGNNEGNSTFGLAGSRYWEVNRTFQYQYLHSLAGAQRVPADIAAAMLAKQDAIIEAICELDISGVDVTSVNCSNFGSFSDPSETAQFYGFTLSIGMREKVNP